MTLEHDSEVDLVEVEYLLRIRKGFIRTFGEPPNEVEIETILRLGRLAKVHPLVNTFDEIDYAIRNIRKRTR